MEDNVTKIQAQILEVEDEEDESEDIKYRVSLKLKEGDKFTYAKFTKQVMSENLKMFEDCTLWMFRDSKLWN